MTQDKQHFFKVGDAPREIFRVPHFGALPYIKQILRFVQNDASLQHKISQFDPFFLRVALWQNYKNTCYQPARAYRFMYFLLFSVIFMFCLAIYPIMDYLYNCRHSAYNFKLLKGFYYAFVQKRSRQRTQNQHEIRQRNLDRFIRHLPQRKYRTL